MYYIDPINITDAAVVACSLAQEDPTPAWSAGTFAVGDERHVVAMHRVYRCAIAGASALSPELEPARWKDMRPTNRWAPFDWYGSTRAQSGADISYDISARYVTSVAAYNLSGSSLRAQVFDGATQVYDSGARSLQRPARGYWDYGFGQRERVSSVLLQDLPLLTTGTVRVTVAGSSTRAIGTLVLGKLRSLRGKEWGGVQWGAEAKPKSYSYRKVADDGSITYIPRGAGVDLALDAVFDSSRTDTVVQQLSGIIGRPIAWFATDLPRYTGLAVFGIATGTPVRYAGPGHSTCSLTIEGIVSQ